jgi:hypothetical protein
MAPIAPEESATATIERGAANPLGRVVQVALAIYLMPVIAIVCAIGGASIAIGEASRFASRLRFEGGRAARPGHPPLLRLKSSQVISRARSRDWNRVGR